MNHQNNTTFGAVVSTMKTVVLLLLLASHLSHGFIPIGQQWRTSSSSSLNCICINCKHVTNCGAYHFVEEKHEQPHISKSPTFEPRNGSPTIDVHMRPVVGKSDEEERMKREHKAEEEKAEAAAAAAGSGVMAPGSGVMAPGSGVMAPGSGALQNPTDSSVLIGETVYDMRPEMTLEYDVVSCEDFLEDMGAWVKNMPEEIRRANPEFVPS